MRLIPGQGCIVYFDGFREFPGFPGLPERPPEIARIPTFLAEMQRERFDLAIQLHGSGPFVNPLTTLFGAHHCAGFFLPGDYCPEPERFPAVGRELADRGLTIVLTGTSAEATVTAEFARAIGRRCINLAGRTDLGALGALFASMRLLVCNDTGISHVAAALRVPSVVISTGDNPARWAPVDSSLHHVLCRESDVAVDEVVGNSIEWLDAKAAARAHQTTCRLLIEAS